MAEIGFPVSNPSVPGNTIPSDPTVSDIIPCSAKLKDINPEKIKNSSCKGLCSENTLNEKDAQVTCVNYQTEEALTAKTSSLHRQLLGENMSPTKQDMQRYHPETPQIQQKGQIHSLQSENIEHCSLGRNQEAPLILLVCKEAVHTQQSSGVTTFCRGASHPIHARAVQSSASGCAQVSEEFGKPSRLKAAASCSPYHQAAAEDTFAAYCHPQPIPAPAQVVPRLMTMEGNCKGQITGPTLLSLPPLVSSVSETRLDHCCGLDCRWPGLFCQNVSQRQLVKEVRKMKDVATMTSCSELKDKGVQVGQDLDKSLQHVFPTVRLVEERQIGNDKFTGQHKSPVKDVKWDSEGMTWEVYGASVDPEELGLAIQKHLELQIQETTIRSARFTQQNTTTSKLGNEKRKSNRRKGIMAALHPSVCCSRNSTAVD